MKRLFVLLMVCALCVACAGMPNPGERLPAYEPMTALTAGPPTIQGDWATSGKVTVSANFGKYFSLTLTFPNIGVYGDTFHYDASGNFSDDLLGMTGTYTETSKGTFTVDLSSWVTEIQSELQSLLAGYGVTATVAKQSFTGKVTGATTATGSFLVVINVSAPFAGQVSISGALTGKRVKMVSANLAGSPPTPQTIANDLLEKVLLPLFGLPAK